MELIDNIASYQTICYVANYSKAVECHQPKIASKFKHFILLLIINGKSIGVGTGGLSGLQPPNILLCIKELTVIED